MYNTKRLAPVLKLFMIVGAQAKDESREDEGGMEEQLATLGIQVTIGPDDDAEATLRLRRELLQYEVSKDDIPIQTVQSQAKCTGLDPRGTYNCCRYTYCSNGRPGPYRCFGSKQPVQ